MDALCDDGAEKHRYSQQNSGRQTQICAWCYPASNRLPQLLDASTERGGTHEFAVLRLNGVQA